jgi:hypothetical protein
MITADDESTTIQAAADQPKPTTKATAAPRKPRVAPSKAKSGKKPTPPKKAAKTAKYAKKAGKPKPAPGAREGKGSKTEKVLDLLKRSGGVTLKDLMKATGWQPHSVRGFLSGTVGKKMGLTVTSVKGENEERTYSIES